MNFNDELFEDSLKEKAIYYYYMFIKKYEECEDSDVELQYYHFCYMYLLSESVTKYLKQYGVKFKVYGNGVIHVILFDGSILRLSCIYPNLALDTTYLGDPNFYNASENLISKKEIINVISILKRNLLMNKLVVNVSPMAELVIRLDKEGYNISINHSGFIEIILSKNTKVFVRFKNDQYDTFPKCKSLELKKQILFNKRKFHCDVDSVIKELIYWNFF